MHLSCIYEYILFVFIQKKKKLSFVRTLSLADDPSWGAVTFSKWPWMPLSKAP